MAELTKVSVIIPVYDAEKYIGQCLDSVVNQTLREIEIICIDDGSGDDSLTILNEYKQKDGRIQVICQTNQGPGPARNTGMRAAAGEYIAFMDADDKYPDDRTLERMYTQAKEADALICGGGIEFFDAAEERMRSAEQNSFKRPGWIAYEDYQQYFYFQRFIYRRELIESNKIEFPPYLRFQDPPFFVRCMLTANGFFALDYPTYSYRVGSNHVMWTEGKVSDMLQGMKDIARLCIEHHLEKLYDILLERSIQSDYFKSIIEPSFISGNDDVVEYYRFLCGCVHDYPEMNEKWAGNYYMEQMASWDGKRHMTFGARSIKLQDPEENSLKVSVIIPAYNTRPYLRSCVESITSQTLKSIEIICIDDGSTDGSGEELERMKNEDDRIRVFHQSNQGVSAARNAGMQHARGEYVYFMDSDDILEHDALAKLTALADQNSADKVFFSAASFFDDEFPEPERSKCKLPMAYSRAGVSQRCMSGPEMFMEMQNCRAFYVSVCIQISRTDFLRKYDLAFIEGILHEDIAFTVESLLRAERCCCLDEPFFNRRIRACSIMTRKFSCRNLIGYYHSITTLCERLGSIQLQQTVEEAVRTWLGNTMRWQVLDRWDAIDRSDKTLFFASLTEIELNRFYAFFEPAIFCKKKNLNDAALITRQKEEVSRQREEVSRQREEVSRQKEEVLRLQAEVSRQKEEASRQKEEALRQEAQASKLNAEVIRLKAQNAEQDAQQKKIASDLYHIRHSASFRIGRVLTLIPRKLRGLFRK